MQRKRMGKGVKSPRKKAAKKSPFKASKRTITTQYVIAGMKKKAKKTSKRKSASAGNIFLAASKDKAYKTAKKRAEMALKMASKAYKIAVKKARAKRK